MLRISPADPRRSALELGVILFLGLLMGLIYVFLVPPWQHYDEPAQFEYAWLVANRDEWPQPGAYDQRMRRELAASMLTHNFFRDLDYRPNLLSNNEPVWIGISQLGDQPFYYWYTSLPLRIFRYTDITFQLYLARLASLLLYLLTLVAAWGIVKELVPHRYAYLRWLVPVTLVFIPGFTDLMTATNNDVGATWAFSWFLWGSIRTLKLGTHPFELLWSIAAAALCYLTKSTVYLAIPLLVMVFLFSLLRDKWRPLAWGMTCFSLIVGAVAFFTWGNALYWTPITPMYTTTRIQTPDAVLGDHALYLAASPENRNPRLHQLLPTEQARNLAGQAVTFGTWAWAERPTEVTIGIYSPETGPIRRSFEASETPGFHAFHINLPENQNRLWVELRAASPVPDQTTLVYFDGISLAHGSFDLETLPVFDSTQASTGNWGAVRFQNVIRNASIETGWLEIRPWLYRSVDNIPVNFAILVGSIFDLPAAGWYYQSSLSLLHQTFWARFGWGHVPVLEGQVVYPVLWIFSLLGMIGVLLLVGRRWKSMPKVIGFLLGTAVLVIWVQAGLRGIGSLFGEVLIPVARYAAPAAIPTILLLTTGWVELTKWFSRLVKINPAYVLPFYYSFLAGLNLLAIYSLYHYYYL